jgi:DNA-binding transcriptional ArsR family regulator
MQDQLSSTFAALADPTRRAILARLALGETSVTELARPFEMSMPAVSKHLKVLEHAGLIARGREAQWRPCRLEAGPLKEAASWIEEYRRFWSPYMDALERHLDRMEHHPAHEFRSVHPGKPKAGFLGTRSVARKSTPRKQKTKKRPKPRG